MTDIIDADFFDSTLDDGESTTLTVSAGSSEASAIALILDDGTQGGTPSTYDFTARTLIEQISDFAEVATVSQITKQQVSVQAFGPQMQVELTNQSGLDGERYRATLLATDDRPNNVVTDPGGSSLDIQRIEHQEHSAFVTNIQSPAADISGGVTASPRTNRDHTLYLNTAGAVDVTVELSPDSGDHWYEIAESPITISSATDDVTHIGYSFDTIRLTGSNATNVLAQMHQVM